MNWTKQRASEDIDNKKRRKSKMKKRFNMKLGEIKAFFGCLIVRGIVRQPGLNAY